MAIAALVLLGALAAGAASAKEARLAKPPLGSFTEPRGLAVDQGSNEVYAIDGRSEVQKITVSASAGNFRLKFGAAPSEELASNAGSSEVRDALRNLICGGAACLIVNGGPGDATGSNPYLVEFNGELATTDLEQLSCESGSPPLSGGSGCTVETIANGVNGTIARYHADGSVSNFSALGSNTIDGRGGADLTPQVGLHFSAPSREQIAVDESGTATGGDIYVTQFNHHLLDVFASSGEFKGQLSEYEETPGNPATLKPLKNVCGVAVDVSGNVYVADISTGIHKYAPSGNPVKNTDTVANFSGVSFPCGLAAGAGPSAGFLFADGVVTGGLFKLDDVTGEVKYKVAAGTNTTVSVDPSSGHVLTATGSEVREFDASGATEAKPVEPLGSVPVAKSPLAGIAVDGTTGKDGTVYLSRAGTTHLDVFGPLVLVPDVVTLGASEVTGTTATLSGTISAAEGPSASCSFQYTTKAAFEADKAISGHDGFTGALTVPCAQGPFSGSEVHSASAKAEGLATETKYEFRIVGENANTSVPADDPGKELELETLGKPIIEGGTASQITATSALISGAVNPRGLETEAAVEYVTKEAFEADKAISGHDGFTGAARAAAPTLPGSVTGTGNLAAATGTGAVAAGSDLILSPATETGEFEAGETLAATGLQPGTEIVEIFSVSMLISKPATQTVAAASGTGDLTEGSTTIENATVEFDPGALISGTKIPPHTTVTNVEEFPLGKGKFKLTLSAAVEAGGTATAVQLHSPGAPLTATSTRVKNLSTTGGHFGPGQAISGPGIAPGTTVLSAQAGQLTLSKPATERVVGAALVATGFQPLSQKLTGLAPETAYVFRLVASSSVGAAEPGGAGEFATFALPAPLLDERAYEMVTPAAKAGEPYVPEPSQRGGLGGSCFRCTPGWDKQRMPMQSSPDGDALAYEGNPFEAGLASGANEYRSRRGEAGWQTKGLSGPQFRDEVDVGQGFKAFSSDLTKAIIMQAAPSLSAEAPPDFANLYLQEEGKEELTTLITVKPPEREAGINTTDIFRVNYGGANAGTALVPEMSHVIFQANDALTSEEEGIAPEAPEVGVAETDLYEWSGGQLHLVNVLPGNAEAAPNAVLGSGLLLASGGGENSNFSHAISDDGARIFWSTKPGGQVYVREGGTTTSKVPDPGKFLTATPEGSEVLLSDGMIYDLEDETLSDLTGGAGGFKGILGTSEDLSRIYFVDSAVLSGEENANKEEAVKGEPNLYLWEEGAVAHEGTTRFIARLLPTDNNTGGEQLGAWHAAPGNRLAQVSPDGRFLAFESRASLTGYDSTIAEGEGCVGNAKLGIPQCFEVFEYDATSHSLTCPSCNPSGERPLGASNLALIRGENNFLPQPQNLPPEGKGRLFFESQDTLTPSDRNGHIQDVYEWEPGGVGTCTRPKGCLGLISNGQSPKDSHFINASATGNDVFFDTRSQLVASDKDDFLDIYDARVGGGFNEEEGAAPCAGEACAGPLPSTPPFEAPASSLVEEEKGSPPPRRCKAGFVRRHGKCVRKHHKRHRRVASHRGGAR